MASQSFPYNIKIMYIWRVLQVWKIKDLLFSPCNTSIHKLDVVNILINDCGLIHLHGCGHAEAAHIKSYKQNTQTGNATYVWLNKLWHPRVSHIRLKLCTYEESYRFERQKTSYFPHVIHQSINWMLFIS